MKNNRMAFKTQRKDFYTRRLLLAFVAMVSFFISGYATNYTSNNVTGNWSTPGTWSPAGIPGAGDNVTISQGTITVDVTSVITNLTLSGGTLKLSAGLTVYGAWLNNSGTFTPNTQTVTFGNPGATSSPTIGGTASTTFYGLTISTFNTTDIVSLNGGLANTIYIAASGTLTLNKGVFKIGASYILSMAGSTIINNPTANMSNFATTGANGGDDGGTVTVTAASLATFAVNGPGSTTFYNLNFTAGATFNNNNDNTTSITRINGKLTVVNGSFTLNNYAPVYGAVSTLEYNVGGGGTDFGASNKKVWTALTGTINSTPGYPNNVTITGGATGVFTSATGSRSINGSLSITGGTLNLGAMGAATVLTVGKDVILTAGTLTVGSNVNISIKGNWSRASGATFTGNANRYVEFAGSGTALSPQTITGPGAVEDKFFRLTINNGTYVKMLNPVTLPVTTGLLTLTSGIIETNGNALTINNTAAASVTGSFGSGTFINGALTRATSTTGSYTFPVGAGTTYLPFSISGITTGGTAPVITVTAYNADAGAGATFNSPITYISHSEYWAATYTNSLTGGTVTLGRTISPGGLDLVAQSAAQAGTYTSIGGTVSVNNITATSSTGGALGYFVLASDNALPVVSTVVASSVNTTAATLNGTFNTANISSTTYFSYGTSVSSGLGTPATSNSPITSNTATAGSANLTGLTPNTLYTFKAVCGPSSGSDLTFTTLPDPPTVGGAAGEGDNISSTGFTAHWTVPAAPGTASYTYEVQVSTNGSTFSPLAANVTGIASGTTASGITGLAPNQGYYYRVRILGAGGYSVWSSNSALVTTLLAPAVTTLAATLVTTASATLNGTFNTLTGTVATEFSYGTVTSSGLGTPASLHSPMTNNTAVPDSAYLTGLTPNTLYTFKATAGGGNGGDLTFTTLPNPPTIGTVGTINNNGFIANWTAPAITGSAAYTYTIQVSLDGVTFIPLATSASISSGLTTATITGLTPGQIYYYRVRVVSTVSGGVSAWSASSAAVTTTTNPIVTTTAATLVTTTTATLNGTFNTLNVPAATGFSYGTVSSSGLGTPVSLHSPITSNAAVIDSAYLTGLTPNTLYTFKAASGSSNGSDLTFTTLPNPPAVGTGNAQYASGFTANWTAPAIPGSAAYTYTVEVSVDGSTFSPLAATVTGVTLTNTVISGLASGTIYYYRVKVVSTVSGGISVWSATSAAVSTTGTADLYFRSNVTTGNWGTAASWISSDDGTFTGIHLKNPAVTIPNVGAVVQVLNGHTITLDVSTAAVASTTIETGGTLNCGTNLVNGTTFTLSTRATLGIGSADGITTPGTGAGNIRSTNRNYSTSGDYVYNAASGNQVTGTGLPATIRSLTINTTASAQVVSLTNSVTIRYESGNGVLNLNRGILNIAALNSSNTIYFDNNSASNAINNPNAAGTSNLATTGTNGADGGTIVVNNGSGADFTINGPGLTTFYNISVGTSLGNGNRKIIMASANTVRINGKLSAWDNQFKWSGNSPVWGPASTFSINYNGQQYTPGGANSLEWIPITPGSGTIGTTAGYPNNVILMNMGISANNSNGVSCGFSPNGGDWSINGTLTIGDGTTNCMAEIARMNSFSCGGILIDNNSTLVGASFTVKGNWRRQGGTIGTYVNVGTGTVTFSGGTGSGAPQTISISAGTETQFRNITLSGANTYVKLNSALTLGVSGILTMTTGILDATSNILTISNDGAAAITGGSATAYIYGPLTWSLPAGLPGTTTYTIPLGKFLPSSAYLPFAIKPTTTVATSITVEAFNTNSGGTPDNVTVTGISTTEYWSLSATAGMSANVSAGRTTSTASVNMLAKATTGANGIYSGIGGLAGTVGGVNGIAGGSISGTPAPWYFVLGYGPLSINVISIVHPTTSCLGGLGSITVSGSGGVPPYNYDINNAGTFANTTGIFTGLTAGTYTLRVRDAAMTIKSTTVTLSEITLTADTTICSGSSVQLLAGGSAVSYSWSPATGLSSTTIANPVATPTTTTTYTVTAKFFSNLLQNPGFESGNTGFTSDYIYLNGNIPYGAAYQHPSVGTTSHKGIYALVTNSTGLCSNFNSVFGDHTSGGGAMMVIDGPNDGISTTSRIWSQTISGLNINTDYTFTYWIRYASNGTPLARVKTQFNGVDATGASANPFTSPSGWTQVTYTWNSGASTSVTINLFDIDNADTGNDFAIDDMAFGLSNCTVPKSVVVSVSASTSAVTVSGSGNICVGNSVPVTVNFTPSGTGAGPWEVTFSDGTTSSLITGIVTNPYTYTAFPVTNTTYTVTAVKNACGNVAGAAITGSASFTVTPYKIWNGSLNNANWNDSANWCGGVPTLTTDALIPSNLLTPYPILSNAPVGKVKNITIQGGAGNPSVTVSNNATLQIAGTITNSGAFNATAGTIEMIGSTPQTIAGSMFVSKTIRNLKISNMHASGVTVANVNDTLKLTGELSFGYDSARIATGDNIVLISNAATTARIAEIQEYTGGAPKAVITGKIIIERYYPKKRAWRLVTAPVDSATAPTINQAWQEGASPSITSVTNPNPHPPYGTHITGPYNVVHAYTSLVTSSGFDQSPQNNSSMKFFTGGVAGVWSPAQTTADKVTNKPAYLLFVRGDRSYNISVTTNYATPSSATLRIKGTARSGRVAMPVDDGFQVVGNPYASAIKFGRGMVDSNLSVLFSHSYSIWDPIKGSKRNSPTNVGGWVQVSYNKIADIYNSTYDPNTVPPSILDSVHTLDLHGEIQSGSAFVIDVKTGANPLVDSFVFHEHDKMSGSNNYLFRPLEPTEVIPSLRVNMYSLEEDNTPAYWADGTLDLFHDSFNNNVDWSEDVRKMNSTTENLSIRRENQLIAIEERQPVNNAGDTIFYNIDQMKLGKYRFDFIPSNWSRPDLEGYIEDCFTGTRILFNPDGITSVPFTISNVPGSYNSSRFRLVFGLPQGGPLPVTYTSIKAWQQNRDIAVEWKVDNELNIKEYQVERSPDGRNFSKTNITAAKGNNNSSVVYNWLDPHPAAGTYYYRIRSIDQSLGIKYSNVVKVTIGKGEPGIAVYPNPVKDGAIALQLNNMPKGNYTVRILNAAGQLMMVRKIMHEEGGSSETISLKEAMASGVYDLEVTGPGNYKKSIKIVYL